MENVLKEESVQSMVQIVLKMELMVNVSEMHLVV
jgi:hypothetical protein